MGAGIHPNFETAVAEMTHIGETFEPDAAVHRIYDHFYHNVYQKMYPRLQPLYRAIQKLT